VVTATVVVAFFVALYVLGVCSEPYKVSTRFIRDSGVVKGELGGVKSVRLSFFGYRVTEQGSSGSAEYTLHVVGSRRAGTVYLNLRRAAGLWRVEEGNLVLRTGESRRLSAGPGGQIAPTRVVLP
jgi:hypothetical protein